ncbi:MAG TPA: hypothetical protein VF074_03505 [Pyrinomonadaceae bacterium]
MRFPYGKAIGYAVLIWIVGFVWGSIVFKNPSMHVAPIPYVSSNPAISFPILIIWFVLTYLLARSFLKASANPDPDGRKLGLIFSAVNFILDVIVLVILLKAGIGYFAALSIWFAYTMLFMMPWLIGRSLAKARPD